ncbi:MAG: hypothetical protein M3O34_19050, partial [Chloroflexota bacterium]|nr:hypothetical protein [Chloroflexota bacterium]
MMADGVIGTKRASATEVDSALDWRQVEWPRVARAVYAVRQQYRYAYTGPVTDVWQRLMMVPPDRAGDQRLLDHELVIRGADGEPRIVWREDEFGNSACRVRADR